MTRLRSNLEEKLGWAVLLLLIFGCLVVLWPFVTALLWAAVLAFSSWPIYRRLLSWLGGRRNLAAILVSLAMILVVLLPFGLVGLTLANNVTELQTATKRWLDAGPPSPPQWLGRLPVVGPDIVERWEALSVDSARLLREAKRFVEPVGSWLIRAGFKLGVGLLQLAISILITFVFLRNGPWLAGRLTSAVGRISGERGKHLLRVAGNTVRGVVYGILGTAMVQAFIAGVGFFVAGVPGAPLLALLTFFLSIVPVGPPLVWLPAALWLFQQGRTGWGIFMLIWGVGVSTVDNFVKPWLISQGSSMPFLLILFGVAGGALAFGFIGVFIGPTVLSVGYRVVEEWLASRAPSVAVGTGEAESEVRVQ